MGLSIFAYTACGFFQLLKVTTTCFMIKYSSLTYRLIAAKVKMLPQPTDDDQRSKVHVQDLKKLVELHRKAYGYLNDFALYPNHN